MKSWNRFSDSVPRKRAERRSVGDTHEYKWAYSRKERGCEHAGCLFGATVTLASCATQDVSVFWVCESCMTPGTVDQAVRRLVTTRDVTTHISFTHTSMARAGF